MSSSFRKCKLFLFYIATRSCFLCTDVDNSENIFQFQSRVRCLTRGVSVIVYITYVLRNTEIEIWLLRGTVFRPTACNYISMLNISSASSNAKKKSRLHISSLKYYCSGYCIMTWAGMQGCGPCVEVRFEGPYCMPPDWWQRPPLTRNSPSAAKHLWPGTFSSLCRQLFQTQTQNLEIVFHRFLKLLNFLSGGLDLRIIELLALDVELVA